MRLFIYGTLSLLALVLGIDTHLGDVVTPADATEIRRVITVLEESDLPSDAMMARSILKSDGYRRSRFFDWLNHLSETRGSGFGFYAYTPVLSKHLIFLGENYWRQDNEGRASVTVHELAHLRRHRDHGARGLSRRADEYGAYSYQYLTYPRIGIDPQIKGSDVYWDMMYGIRDYVVPVSPEYAKREDIAHALMVISLVEQ